MENPHEVTRVFEAKVADYTGAPYCVAVDNASNALFLALMYDNIQGKEIMLPRHTYMSVPCEVIHAGGRVIFDKTNAKDQDKGLLKGAYWLVPSHVWDSALRFTANMYIPNMFMCCSFTGPYKHLKLGKGGCILTDNEDAYKWFKRARFSGRNECSYHEDKFDMLGWNFYMNPVIAELGLLLMQQFYNLDGSKKHNEDLTLPYPDLSEYPIYTHGTTNSK